MAAKLHFSLVSPERELFSGEVDQVDAPGSEGDFGVLAGHSPFMTTLKTGFITIHDGDRLHRFEVQGGFADVTPQGFIVLAEKARDGGGSMPAWVDPPAAPGREPPPAPRSSLPDRI